MPKRQRKNLDCDDCARKVEPNVTARPATGTGEEDAEGGFDPKRELIILGAGVVLFIAGAILAPKLHALAGHWLEYAVFGARLPAGGVERPGVGLPQPREGQGVQRALC